MGVEIPENNVTHFFFPEARTSWVVVKKRRPIQRARVTIRVGQCVNGSERSDGARETRIEKREKLSFPLNDDISGTENRIRMKQKPF